MNHLSSPQLRFNRTINYQAGVCGLGSLIFSVLAHLCVMVLLFWHIHRQEQKERDLNEVAWVGCRGEARGSPSWSKLRRPVLPLETAGKSRPDASKSVKVILRQSQQASLGPLAVAPAAFDAAAVYFYLRDTDKDNKLSLWECCQNDPLKKQRFAEADRNRDGYLSREEFVYGGLADFGYH